MRKMPGHKDMSEWWLIPIVLGICLTVVGLIHLFDN